MTDRRLNLPNAITVARILVCPLLFFLVLSTRPGYLLVAFVLFLAAAVSDLWDGYLARKHGLVTDMGKLLDPVADKLLLITTLVPFYMISLRPGDTWDVPWWGPFPLWVVLVILGRELAITIFRSWAARRGDVISAGPSGKIKALSQNVFAGALILWYALLRMAEEEGWVGTPIWEGWAAFHGAVVAIVLVVALVLTVYSMGVYLWQYRIVVREARARGG